MLHQYILSTNGFNSSSKPSLEAPTPDWGDCPRSLPRTTRRRRREVVHMPRLPAQAAAALGGPPAVEKQLAQVLDDQLVDDEMRMAEGRIERHLHD